MFMRNSVSRLSSEMEGGGAHVRAVLGPHHRRHLRRPAKAGIPGGLDDGVRVDVAGAGMAILLLRAGPETLPVAIYSFIDNGSSRSRGRVGAARS